MRRHAVMRHGPPRMILRSRLREPNVACVAGKLSAVERPDDHITVAYLATRGVHDVGAALHLRYELVVEHMLGLGVQRTVDRDNIANPNHQLDVWVEIIVEFLFHIRPQAMAIGVVKLNVEGLQASQHRDADSAAATVPAFIPSRSYERATQSAMFQPPFTTHWLMGYSCGRAPGSS